MIDDRCISSIIRPSILASSPVEVEGRLEEVQSELDFGFDTSRSLKTE
jgi:hypothetical protein